MRYTGKKYFVLPLIFIFAQLSFCFAQNTENLIGGSNIKLIAPTEMVSPSVKKEAMENYTRGTQLLYATELTEAEKYLKKALELDPLFVDAMDHLGIVYRRQNRLTEAEKMYLKSIEISDSIGAHNSVPYQNLAIVYRMQNRMGEAYGLYKKMAEMDAENPEVYYGMGEILYIAADDYKNALAFFEKALELYQQDNSPYAADAFFYMGLSHFQLDEYEQALFFLQEAQKIDTDNAAIKKAIEQIQNKKPRI